MRRLGTEPATKPTYVRFLPIADIRLMSAFDPRRALASTCFCGCIRARRYRAIFGLALIFALVMALLPQPPQLPGDPSDKAQHIVAFATLAGLGAVAYPSMSLLLLLVGLSALGAVIELLQAIPALNRDSDRWTGWRTRSRRPSC